MRTCEWLIEGHEACGKPCEGKNALCASHGRLARKQVEDAEKSLSKRAALIAKQKAKNQVPRKTISKNPKDWSNTFLCSDGTRVTQLEINILLRDAYQAKYPENLHPCEGCGIFYVKHHAHIIPQSRCKHIGKTDLIWHPDNFFRADHACNSALENPKGKEWKRLLNIEHCLEFMKSHDPELYTKFELSAVNQERETI